MNIVAVLHNIRSMHNVGSIFRTADAAGCKKIYLCGITPGPLNKFKHPNRALLKVSLGAEQSVKWEHARSTNAVIKRLQRDNYYIIVIEQQKGSQSLFCFSQKKQRTSSEKVALVLGNEIHGVPLSIGHQADTILEIPMYGTKKSLNVAIAFGIAVYHLVYIEKRC